MGLARRLLWGSAAWEVARPRTPLTAGHLLIRLSNPATALDQRSASDWLRCHKAAHTALTQVLGVTRCTLMFAYQWHALGAALGEPVAESSTPTFHLFGRWDAEPVTPGSVLALPAHRRTPLGDDELVGVDLALRDALRAAAAFDADVTVAADDPDDGPLAGDNGTGALTDIVTRTPGHPTDGGHRVLTFHRSLASISDVRPAEVLALAKALEGFAADPTVSGLSCIAPDPSTTGSRLELHVLGRSANESRNPLAALLDSPELSQALL
ncbi:hypothetical protein ACW0JT_09740 [Arthrobacter sp. SA17]